MKLAEHVEGQLIPAGELLTAPVPVPASVTFRANCTAVLVKVAVTAWAWLIVTEQLPVPVQAPLQPANVDPDTGAAVRLTTVPLLKLAEHVEGQLIPAGELLTAPVPVPASVTFRANWLPLPTLRLIEVVALLPLVSIAIAVRVRGLKLPETELNVAV